MLDSNTFKSGETLDITPYGDVELHNVIWNADQDVLSDSERYGCEYSDPYNYEFVSARLGGLLITRDMLVEMLSEAEVCAIEQAKGE